MIPRPAAHRSGMFFASRGKVVDKGPERWRHACHDSVHGATSVISERNAGVIPP